MKKFLLTLLLCSGAPAWLEAAGAGAPQVAANPEEDRGSAYLGVFLQPVPAIALAQLKMEEGRGLAVVQIDSHAPVARSGLKIHDIILKIGDEPLYSSSSISRILKNHKPGEVMKCSVVRGGETKEIEIELGRRQSTPIPAAMPPEMQKLMEAGVADPKLPAEVRQVMELQLAQARRFARETQVAGICSRIHSRDKEHYISMNIHPDGSKNIRIEDVKGVVLLECPYNGPEDLKSLSPDLRDKVTRLYRQLPLIELRIGDEPKP
ncbi:MAG: hypothetical protein RL095_3030 [Verrucomicrobiota bacterium]